MMSRPKSIIIGSTCGVLLAAGAAVSLVGRPGDRLERQMMRSGAWVIQRATQRPHRTAIGIAAGVIAAWSGVAAAAAWQERRRSPDRDAAK